jgi:hypothetical protein
MAKSKVKEKQETKYELTALDRCDRCPAEAYVRATGVGGELYFCGHHFAGMQEILSKWAFEIIDEREKLVENKLID